MTAEEIRKKVEEIGPWFHCIDLGHGILTKNASVGSEPADHPRRTWEKVKPHVAEDLSGLTVLDVGCNGGFYSIEMKRRGADRVVAIDTDEEYLAQARFAAEVTGGAIEFQ